MSLSSLADVSGAAFARLMALAFVLVLSGCQFEPLHGSGSASGSLAGLDQVGVAPVDTRVAQRVRNHLLFLLNGGFGVGQNAYEAKLRVSDQNKQLASVPGEDTTSGTVTVSVSYDLVEVATGKVIASGNRKAFASYDRTSQVFADERAALDAQNRAAREAAEALRLAIASDLKRIGT